MVKLTETQAVGLFDAVLIEAALGNDREAVRELARRYEAALDTIEAQDAEIARLKGDE